LGSNAVHFLPPFPELKRSAVAFSFFFLAFAVLEAIGPVGTKFGSSFSGGRLTILGAFKQTTQKSHRIFHESAAYKAFSQFLTSQF
jgi:hypothetical protein